VASQMPDFATLQVRRTLAAPREKVFRAWTELEALDHWMCRDVPTHEVKYLELNVRTRLLRQARGIFKEIDANG
jgi:uncharacterized protein YndB with AHSA1/START domain